MKSRTIGAGTVVIVAALICAGLLSRF
jgi:hypothetical protein